MNDGKSRWDAIVDLCENNKMPEQWGYDVDASGKKILAKNFVVSSWFLIPRSTTSPSTALNG
jgi:hypothetical protein